MGTKIEREKNPRIACGVVGFRPLRVETPQEWMMGFLKLEHYASISTKNMPWGQKMR